MEFKSSNLLDLGCELGEKSRVCLAAAVTVCLVFGMSSHVIAQEGDDAWRTIDIVGQRLWQPNVMYAPDPRPYSTSTGDMISDFNLQQQVGSTDQTSNRNCATMKSNPIDYSTGNKIEDEVDFSGEGYEMPLQMSRTYNSKTRESL